MHVSIVRRRNVTYQWHVILPVKPCQYINEHDVISSRDRVKSVLFTGFEILTLHVTCSCTYCEKAAEQDSFSQVFFTGCDYMKSALFTGFEILDPVKKPVKKLHSKILFHRFYFTGFLTGFFTGFDPVKSALFTGFQKFHIMWKAFEKTHEN